MRVWVVMSVLWFLLFSVEASVGWQVDLSRPEAWKPMLAWLGNPDPNARVQRTAVGLRFVVPEASKGMKWMLAPSWVHTGRYRYLTVRYRARGVFLNPNDYFLYLNDSSDLPLSRRFMITLGALRADGQWHWAVVDLRAKGVRPYLSQLAIHVQAAEPHAEVVLGELAFRESLPPGVSLPRPAERPYREQVLALEQLARLQAQPGWLGNPSARASATRDAETIRLRVPDAGRGMKWSLRLPQPLDLRETPYVVVQYRARGIAPSNDYFLYLAPAEPSLPQEHYVALRLNELASVDKWRTVVAPVPEASQPEVATLAVQLQAVEPDAEVVIRSVRFVSQPRPTPLSLEDDLPAPRRVAGTGYAPVDLLPHYNGSLRRVLSPEEWKRYQFSASQVMAAGVPFRVATGERNVVTSPSPVGVATLSVPLALQRQAPTEVYLLLAADFPQWEEPSYGGGALYRVQHPHRLTVQLVYADGTSEEVFPLRVSTRRHEVVAGVDVYVVPASGRVREVRLRDRMRLGEFGVCALTLNVGKRRFDPALWRVSVPTHGRRGRWNAPTAVQVREEAGLVTLQGANLRVQVDTTSGIRLRSVELLPLARRVLVEPAPLFAVRPWGGGAGESSAHYRAVRVSPSAEEVKIECAPPVPELPTVLLKMRLDPADRLQVQATLVNGTGRTRRWVVSLPAGWRWRIGERDVYAYPLRTLLLSDQDGDWRFRYGGTLPLQMVDVSNHALGVGIGLLTLERESTDRYLHLNRQHGVTTLGIEWRCDPMASGERRTLSLLLVAHAGDWRETFAQYRQWVSEWYRPLAPRKEWFRGVFAFRQDYLSEGAYDLQHRAFRFAERVELARRAFGACDYLHLFDWGTTPLGRVGDYDPWNNPLPPAERFRAAVQEVQAQGTPVGLYIEGYLADVRSKVAQAHLKEWGWRARDGHIHRWAPDSSEYFMCPGAKGWQQYLTETYRRVWQETGARGYYIDEFGFGDGRDCFATEHGHPAEWHLLRAEGILTRRIRQALPPNTVLYTENFPPDVHTPLQDGSFDYTVNYYQTVSRAWTPLPLRLSRFAFPDFKVFQIIVCDYPTGSNEEAVRQVFFQGDGYWLQGDPQTWFTPETLATLRKCIRILREHADAFASDRCKPLVPTLQGGAFANQFTSHGGRKTVWTLYNANWRSVRGVVMAVPHVPGAKYLDVWNGKPLQPPIRQGRAWIPLYLSPRGVGCVVQVW